MNKKKMLGMSLMALVVVMCASLSRGELRLGKTAQSPNLKIKGVLQEDINGSYDIKAGIYTDKNFSELIFEKTYPALPIQEGQYEIILNQNEIPQGEYWLRIEVQNADGIIVIKEAKLEVMADLTVVAAGSEKGVTDLSGQINLVGNEPDYLVGVLNKGEGTGISVKSKLGTGLYAEGVPDGNAIETLGNVVITGNAAVSGDLSVSGETNLTVGSSQIQDGSIIDADISPTADITASKINRTGLDADLLDGLDSNQFFKTTGDVNLDGNLTVSGNVGVGTTTPTAKLDIVGPVSERYFSAGNGFRVTARDHVGIGTTSLAYDPPYQLEAWSTDAVIVERLGSYHEQGTLLQFENINSPTAWNVGVGRAPWLTEGSFVVDQNNTSPRLVIAPNGNVGIGTTVPERLLQLGNGTRDDDALLRFDTGDGGNRRIWDIGVRNRPGGPYDPDEYIFSIDDIWDNSTNPEFVINMGGNVGIGTVNPQVKLEVAGTTRTGVLQITGGGDIAEPFDIVDQENIQPGMVVSIDPQEIGKLCLSTQAYDHTVAGIVSGAGGVNPGMLMKQEGSAADGSHPIALSGRVYAWADASHGPIKPGDLLTTSNTPGHVMKAADHSQAPGATIGKAMSPLQNGRGLVLVLVNLQ